MTGEGRAQESIVMTVVINLLVLVVLLIPLVLVGSGGWLLYQRQFGERVTAEVISCDFDIGYKRSTQHCLARWKQDGVEHVGPIQASGDQEVGDTITATVHGDELYSRSLALPLILIGLGLPLCWFPFAWARSKLRRG
jgi:hypothetical protein